MNELSGDEWWPPWWLCRDELDAEWWPWWWLWRPEWCPWWLSRPEWWPWWWLRRVECSSAASNAAAEPSMWLLPWVASESIAASRREAPVTEGLPESAPALLLLAQPILGRLRR